MKLEGGKRSHQSHATTPLVSIITVVFQAKQELRQIIENVIQTKDENTEFIIIDGGSDDGTCDLLNEYDASIDYWLSEPDAGIYDAMNKGIAAARGSFIFHLNAGDTVIHLPVKQLEDAKKRQAAAAAFRVAIDDRIKFQPRRDWMLRFNNTLHHQGTFFRRDSIPAYSNEYKVFADFDVNQRLQLQGDRIEVFDEVVATHKSGGTSDINSRENASEFFRVISKNYGRSHVAIAWLFCKWRGLQRRLSFLL